MGEKDKRICYIGTNVTEKVKEYVEKRARERHMSISEYIRYALSMLEDTESPIMQTEQIYSLAESAKILKTSRTTIYALIDKGLLPYIKIGKQKKIKKSDLDEYIEKSRLINNQDKNDKLWTTKELAKHFGCTQQTAQIYLRRGTIPALRFGRKWLVNPEDVEKFKKEKVNDSKSKTSHQNEGTKDS